MGGGGANSLESPKTGENSDFTSDKNETDLSEDNSKEEDTINEYTYKTYDDYFTDYNISKDTISEEDLMGSGSEEDPYVLNSTRGFFYLLTNRLYINSKYIELNCDLVLNDETFDENGTPSGGDGVIYSWKSQGAYTFASTTIYGNGYSIIGCYYNNRETNYMSIFGFGGGNVVKDLNVENLYINAGYGSVGLIAYATVENCTIKGYLIGNGANAGVAYIPRLIKNCKNFVKVISSEAFVSGICFGGIQVINCVNYAPLQGGSVAGISENASYIQNCINYGDLYSNSSYQRISGIATAAREILGCTNYGAIRTEGAGLKGGISYSAKNQARKDIINCTNFGHIERDGTCGEILGNTFGDITINIQNCKGYSVAGCAIIGSTDGNGSQQINLKNIELFADIDNAFGVTVVCAYAGNQNVCWYLENISVKVKNQDTLRLFNTVYAKKIVLNGIVLSHFSDKVIAPENYIFENYNKNAVFVVEGGVVIENKQASEKYYFGVAFDCFYINWKSGEIKLKSLNQGSCFQGQLTEEILINKGFEKKEI